jgi:hypothetical protein
VPFRLFDIEVSPHNQKEDIRNPMIGVYYCPVSGNESFLCNTGLPFQHKGTSKPLHIIKHSGEMPLEKIIEDIFFLANLTWTKVDDCSRDPLSIKMTDIRLRETAGKYDEDAYSFDTGGGGGEDE